MFTRLHALGFTAATCLSSTLLLTSSDGSHPPPLPFDEAVIILEHNATDGDAEIVVTVDAETGLERFRIVNPLGREIIDLRSKHAHDLGTRKIALETPEPSLEDVLAAYPEGWYRFFGRATDGQTFFSMVWLSHDLPAAPTITFPSDGARNVPLAGAAASWTAGPDAEGFFFELEQDDLGVDLKGNLAAGTTSLGFPDGFLQAGTEYQLGLGARSSSGNLSVVEIHFTTTR
jgi:hypothetical protein